MRRSRVHDRKMTQAKKKKKKWDDWNRNRASVYKTFFSRKLRVIHKPSPNRAMPKTGNIVENHC